MHQGDTVKAAKPSWLLPEAQAFRKYCGFLRLSVREWQGIQDRLMQEQLELLGRYPEGERLPPGTRFNSVEAFRAQAPLTSYDDYDPFLKLKDSRLLPAPARQWAFTIGHQGSAKWVPYTEQALERVADSLMAAFILAAATREGEVGIGPGAKVIYNVAPPPYLAGLIARVLEERFRFRAVPPLEKAEQMDFRQRLESGFRLALREGADVVCSLSSVLVRMGEYLEQGQDTRERHIDWHPRALARQARALATSKAHRRPILPKDLIPVKCVVGWGLDTSLYSNQVAYYWGRQPFEFHACTEAGILGVQSRSKTGMTPTPYTAFLEFLPQETPPLASVSPPAPPLLLGELVAGQRYEVVLSSFYGMPFLRYRTGHLVRVLSQRDQQAGAELPQLQLVGRSDETIDLAGFARLDEKTLWQAVSRSAPGYAEWAACKEFDRGHALLRIYLEARPSEPPRRLAEALHASLEELDPGYADIDRMLDYMPVRVTTLLPRTFQKWAQAQGDGKGTFVDSRFPRMNPAPELLASLLNLSAVSSAGAPGSN